MRIFIILVLFIISASPLSAQTLISGTVKDAKTKDPLAFANVNVSGENGTLTNINGSFSLEISASDTILYISYIGYHSRTINLKNAKKNLEIELSPKTELLDQVVISSKENPANEIIKRAIQNKKHNDPTKVLQFL